MDWPLQGHELDGLLEQRLVHGRDHGHEPYHANNEQLGVHHDQYREGDQVLDAAAKVTARKRWLAESLSNGEVLVP